MLCLSWPGNQSETPIRAIDLYFFKISELQFLLQKLFLTNSWICDKVDTFSSKKRWSFFHENLSSPLKKKSKILKSLSGFSQTSNRIVF